MKRYSTSYVNKEMQIKTAMRNTATHLLEWPKSELWQEMLAKIGATEILILLMGMQNGINTLEDRLAVSYEAKNLLLPYDPAIVLLSVCPKELKTYVTQKLHTDL